MFQFYCHLLVNEVVYLLFCVLAFVSFVICLFRYLHFFFLLFVCWSRFLRAVCGLDILIFHLLCVASIQPFLTHPLHGTSLWFNLVFFSLPDHHCDALSGSHFLSFPDPEKTTEPTRLGSGELSALLRPISVCEIRLVPPVQTAPPGAGPPPLPAPFTTTFCLMNSSRPSQHVLISVWTEDAKDHQLPAGGLQSLSL